MITENKEEVSCREAYKLLTREYGRRKEGLWKDLSIEKRDTSKTDWEDFAFLTMVGRRRTQSSFLSLWYW